MKKLLMILFVLGVFILSCTKDEPIKAENDLILKQAELASLSASIDEKMSLGVSPESYRNETARYIDIYKDLSKKGGIQPMIKFTYVEYVCQNFSCSFAMCCRTGTCFYSSCPRCGWDMFVTIKEACD